MLSKIRALDNIGRTKRSNKNEKLENFLTDLQRLTIVHETDHGGSYYRFASGASSPKADDDTDKKGPAKSANTKQEENKAKSGTDGKENSDAAERDKTLVDQHSLGAKAGAHQPEKKLAEKPQSQPQPQPQPEKQPSGYQMSEKQQQQYQPPTPQYQPPTSQQQRPYQAATQQQYQTSPSQYQLDSLQMGDLQMGNLLPQSQFQSRAAPTNTYASTNGATNGGRPAQAGPNGQTGQGFDHVPFVITGTGGQHIEANPNTGRF